MRNGKAAGIDGVPAELIKQAGSSVVSFLHDICNRAWTVAEPGFSTRGAKTHKKGPLKK